MIQEYDWTRGRREGRREEEDAKDSVRVAGRRRGRGRGGGRGGRDVGRVAVCVSCALLKLLFLGDDLGTLEGDY